MKTYNIHERTATSPFTAANLSVYLTNFTVNSCSVHCTHSHRLATYPRHSFIAPAMLLLHLILPPSFKRFLFTRIGKNDKLQLKEIAYIDKYSHNAFAANHAVLQTWAMQCKLPIINWYISYNRPVLQNMETRRTLYRL